jgi:sugar phosphate isomerase/epimerase
MKTSLNTGSFRNINILDVIGLLKLCEIDNIELNLRPVIEENIPKERLLESIKESGIKISNIAGGWCDFFVGEDFFYSSLVSLEKQVELCEFFGNKKLRVFFGLLPVQYTTNEHYDNLLKNVKKISNEFNEIDFMFENHDHNSINPDFLIKFFKDIGSSNIFLNFDPVNLLKGGHNWRSVFEPLKTFIKHTHIKGIKNNDLCSYRKSELDLTDLFEALLRIDYQDFVSLEYEAGGDISLNTILDYFELKNNIKNIREGK